MAEAPPVACGPCATGLCGGRGTATLKAGLWGNNPVSIQVLGICSALAVTTTVENSLYMGAALLLVCAMSNLVVSLLRNVTPHRVRMIAEVAIIATFVILVDQAFRAFYWEMSKNLGPYVALIITNCIIMGRAEAFALQNPPVLSFVDGVANGLGYIVVLGLVGLFRELLGAGTVLGYTVLSESWYATNNVMVLAPGAFLGLGFLIAAFNAINGPQEQEERRP